MSSIRIQSNVVHTTGSDSIAAKSRTRMQLPKVESTGALKIYRSYFKQLHVTCGAVKYRNDLIQ